MNKAKQHFSGLMALSLLAAVFASGLVSCNVTLEPVTPAGQTGWLQQVIPLPKESGIKKKARIAKDQVSIRLVDTNSEMLQAAVSRLAETMGINENGTSRRFEIVVGTCDAGGKIRGLAVPQAHRLDTLANKNQAYVIGPVGKDKLVITGLDEKGVFYGINTLKALMKASSEGNNLIIPLARIVDWPDIAERGRWAGNFFDTDLGSVDPDIDWFPSLKLNLLETLVTYSIDTKGVARCELHAESVRKARLNAINYVPILGHLDKFAGRANFYEVFPELKGTTEILRGIPMTPPCASQPSFVKAVAGWMRAYAKIPGITDISCWLSEMEAQCRCEKCAGKNQYLSEAIGFAKAWQEVREEFPEIRMRILLTQNSYSQNDEILKVVPPGVGIVYYHGSLTYDPTRNEMIYPLLEDYAARGGWLGVYPQLNASWRVVCPWTAPRFIKARCREFADKKLESVTWFWIGNRMMYDFNISAAAEWCWNSNGRSEREFTIAWATQKGFERPDAVADWTELLGPVSWNLYGSRVPFYFTHATGNFRELLDEKQPPVFGKGIYLYWKDLADLDMDIATTRKALEIVRKIGHKDFIDETLIIQGYLVLLKQGFIITDRLARQGRIADLESAGLQESAVALKQACGQITDALGRWYSEFGLGASESGGSEPAGSEPSASELSEKQARLTISATEEMTAALIDALAARQVK